MPELNIRLLDQILLQITGTDQTNVQRYAAARSDKDASRGAVIGCCLAIPTWTYSVWPISSAS